ncbi:ketopantoate reductase family protein [Deinococcus sp.]|uniref:ketopantoate reductase family protein n=1 Tax=Deinococcus sp. TaxID=47478 RepID=UPI003B5CAEA0
MRILIFGRGVIGAMYGWALTKAGHRVEYYVRPGRAAQYGPSLKLDILDARRRINGVRVRESLPIWYVEEFGADHGYDLILLSVPHHQFGVAAAFLALRLGTTTLLIFSNLWADPQTETATLPAEQLVWGFPGAGGSFDEGGVLTGALFGSLQFGTFGPAPTQRGQDVRALFRQMGFSLREHPDFRGWLWLHFVSNAGLLGQVARAGSFARMTASPRHLRQAVLNVRELLPLLKVRDPKIRLPAAELAPFRLPSWLAASALWLAFRLTAPARAVTATFSRDITADAEFQAIQADMLSEARRLGIATPRLEAIETLLASRTQNV